MDNYIVNPVLVRMKESQKGLIYQSIVCMGFRARQINDHIKSEIQNRMADVITDNSDTEGANFDQLAISREFDHLPKPTFLSMKEMTDNKLTFVIPPEEKED